MVVVDRFDYGDWLDRAHYADRLDRAHYADRLNWAHYAGRGDRESTSNHLRLNKAALIVRTDLEQVV